MYNNYFNKLLFSEEIIWGRPTALREQGFQDVGKTRAKPEVGGDEAPR